MTAAKLPNPIPELMTVLWRSDGALTVPEPMPREASFEAEYVRLDIHQALAKRLAALEARHSDLRSAAAELHDACNPVTARAERAAETGERYFLRLRDAKARVIAALTPTPAHCEQVREIVDSSGFPLQPSIPAQPPADGGGEGPRRTFDEPVKLLPSTGLDPTIVRAAIDRLAACNPSTLGKVWTGMSQADPDVLSSMMRGEMPESAKDAYARGRADERAAVSDKLHALMRTRAAERDKQATRRDYAQAGIQQLKCTALKEAISALGMRIVGLASDEPSPSAAAKCGTCGGVKNPAWSGVCPACGLRGGKGRETP